MSRGDLSQRAKDLSKDFRIATWHGEAEPGAQAQATSLVVVVAAVEEVAGSWRESRPRAGDKRSWPLSQNRRVEYGQVLGSSFELLGWGRGKTC